MKVRTLLSALLAVGLLALAAVGVGAWTSSAAGAEAGDPLTVVRFSLTIDGFEIASFGEIDLRSGFEPSELALGTRGIALPAKRTPPTVTLERGMNSGLELSAWHEAALTDVASAQKNATLVMYSVDGSPVARYTLENAWPAKIEIGGLKAGASEVLMETVTIVCESIRRVAP